MRVLVMASDRLRRALVEAAAPDISFVHVTTVEMLKRALRSEAWTVLALDPTLLRDQELESVAALGREATYSLLLCAPFSRASARSAVIAARYAVADVFFTDLDSEARLLVLKLRALRPQSACGLLLHAVSQQIGSLPPAMLSAIMRLFGALPLPSTVSEIISVPTTARRTLDRQLHGAGFRSAKALLEAVRVTWAWDSLRSQDTPSISHVAFHCGYSSAHELWVHTRRLLARPPSLLARTAPSVTVMEPLVAHVILDAAP
jgi:AraC-like DNA-binding protein